MARRGSNVIRLINFQLKSVLITERERKSDREDKIVSSDWNWITFGEARARLSDDQGD